MLNKIKEKMGGFINRLFSLKQEKLSKIKDLFKKENLSKIKGWFKKENWKQYVCVAVILLAIIMLIANANTKKANEEAFLEQQQQLQEQKEVVETTVEAEETETIEDGGILQEYETLYSQNNDMIGWLKIEDTVIDYPVMQTMDDEEYYLKRNFEKEDDDNGCLIMDTDSVVGEGSREFGYVESKEPSSNLIIHGHNMKSGNMFGNLTLYEDEAYGKEHNIICFDSLYEKREYELISVFYSQVFYQHEEVFKFYKFFQADTQEEFDDWYNNIKEMSLYDTGVEAKLGDEFITLSVCAYHVEDGRFVVVGKRVK